MIHEPIYICGPHGAGKTTLRQGLLERTSVLDLPRSRFAAELDEPYLRVLTSAVLYANDLRNHRERLALGIGDRCIIDTLCYLEAFHALEWIDQARFELLDSAIMALMDQVRWPRRVIMLNPEPAVLAANLGRREKHQAMRWRQRSPHLLTALTKSYAALRKAPRVGIDTSDWLWPGDYHSPSLIDDCLAYMARMADEDRRPEGRLQ